MVTYFGSITPEWRYWEGAILLTSASLVHIGLKILTNVGVQSSIGHIGQASVQLSAGLTFLSNNVMNPDWLGIISCVSLDSWQGCIYEPTDPLG